MGTLNFHLPESLSTAARAALDSAVVSSGYELTPVPSFRKFSGSILSLTREANESGYLTVAWPLPELGSPVAISATLRERPEPYHLMLELARGRLNHLRTQTAEWKGIGLTLDDQTLADISETVRMFGHAVLEPTHEDSPRYCEAVLSNSFKLMDRIARLFMEQLLNTRVMESGKLETALGCRLSQLPPPDVRAEYESIFQAVRLVPEWHRLEPIESSYQWSEFDQLVDWAVDAGKKVSIGPLIDLGSNAFPDWLRQWYGDLPSLAAFTCDFIETLVRRYHDKVETWQIFGGFNHVDAMGLTEDDRLRLAARLLESARQTAPASQWAIGLAQPWGDYLANEEYTYSPLVFADTLMRAGFTFAAVELELLAGPTARASQPRDSFEVYRLIDLFGMLGIPLDITVGHIADPAGGQLPNWSETAIGLAFAVPGIRSVSVETPYGPSASAGVTPVDPQFLRLLREHFLA